MTDVANIVSLDLYRRRQASKTLIDPIVAYWKCRIFSCFAKVGVTETAIEVLAMFNAELRKRRDKPIAEHEVMFCEQCRKAREEEQW